jgi:hypothetical protein
MRFRTRCVAAWLPLATFAAPISLTAQKSKPNFDGAWRWVRSEIVSPDSSYQVVGWPGLTVVSGRHFSQFLINSASAGVQQASPPTSAEQKAARYDAILARDGTFEVRDTLFVIRFLHAKDPATVGTTLTVRWRRQADTLWQIVTSKWAKDSTKSVRTAVVWVRER